MLLPASRPAQPILATRSACQKGSPSPGKAGPGRCPPTQPGCGEPRHPGLVRLCGEDPHEASRTPRDLHAGWRDREAQSGTSIHPSPLPVSVLISLQLQKGHPSPGTARRKRSSCPPARLPPPARPLSLSLPARKGPSASTSGWHTAFPSAHGGCNSSCLRGEMRFLSQDFPAHICHVSPTGRKESPAPSCCVGIFQHTRQGGRGTPSLYLQSDSDLQFDELWGIPFC